MGIRVSVRSLWTQSKADSLDYEFTQERIIVGRAGSADVQLPHSAVSSSHATIQAQGMGYVLLDDGSTNGTRINGERVPPGRAKPLRTGDEIDIGGFRLVVTVGVPIAQPTSTERTAALAREMVRALLKGSEDEVDAPRLTVLNGPAKDRRLVLPAPPSTVILGRAETCDLPIPDADASREHVELNRDLTGTIARDMNSKNGLLINQRLAMQKRLQDRDELQIGETLIVYEDPAAERLSQLQEQPDEEVDVLPSGDALSSGGRATPADSRSGGPPASKGKKFSAEMLIFALAGLLVLASVVAIYWLATSE